MRTAVLVFVGGLAGLLFSSAGGALFWFAAGALLAWVLDRSSRQQDRLKRLEIHEIEIEGLRRSVRGLELQIARAARAAAKPTGEDLEEAPAMTGDPERSAPIAPVVPPSSGIPSTVSVQTDTPAPTSRARDPIPPRATGATPVSSQSGTTPADTRSGPLEDLLQRGFSVLKRWFTSGNVPVKVGVIVSFFGVSFLLKYAVDRELLHFPIELRLTLVALGAVVMLVIGWRLRESMRVYALSLQGGAVGILYLTIFATFRIYELIPAGFAFALLVLLTAFAGMLAVLQDSRVLAILGTAGGFLAPVLVSTGSGNHVALFGYYLVLNCAIFGIAWFKVWRQLNLLGFLFTYVVGWSWGYQYYRPELLRSTLPFVVLFFLLFVGIAVLYAYRQAPRLKDYVDGTLVFGTPVVTFSMLAGLLVRTEYAMAASSVAAALVYLVTATLLHRWTTPRHRLLVEAFLALGVVFGTVAIPLALDARWTSAIWALEGAGLIWVGARQRRELARVSGFLLQVAAGVSFFGELQTPRPLPVLNGDWFGTALIAVSSLFGAFYLDRHRGRFELFDKLASVFLLVWGVIWWYFGGFAEIEAQTPERFELAGFIAFCALSAILGVWMSRRLEWSAIAWPGLGLAPLLCLLALGGNLVQSHPFAGGGWIAWPISVAALYWILRRTEESFSRVTPWLHAVTLWLVATVGSLELYWIIRRVPGNALWQNATVASFLGALILLAFRGPAIWPLSKFRLQYRTLGAGPLLVCMLFLVADLNLGSSGDPDPLPYVPVLNPLDLLGMFSILVLALWLLEFKGREPALSDIRVWGGGLGLGGFLLSSATVVRTVHHWAGVPFTRDALFESVVLQAALSLFWGLLGLVAMIYGARRIKRDVWLVGAALMGLVVVKLFLIDLGNSGTLARVLSFIGVGVLLLVVGYFAGVPPRREVEPS